MRLQKPLGSERAKQVPHWGKEPFGTFHAWLLSHTGAQNPRRAPRTPAHGAKLVSCPTGRSCHLGPRLTHGFRMFTHLDPLSPCPLLPPTGSISLTQALGHHCGGAAGDYTCFSPTLSAEGHAPRTSTDAHPLTQEG